MARLVRAGACVAALPLGAACGDRHEPVKLIARPPATAQAEVSAAPPAGPASTPQAPPPVAAVAAAAASVVPQSAASESRQPPPPALAVPQRIVRPGEPTGNDAFRAAIEARSAARAAAGEPPPR